MEAATEAFALRGFEPKQLNIFLEFRINKTKLYLAASEMSRQSPIKIYFNGVRSFIVNPKRLQNMRESSFAKFLWFVIEIRPV
jgi:hypothetical protein